MELKLRKEQRGAERREGKEAHTNVCLQQEVKSSADGAAGRLL